MAAGKGGRRINFRTLETQQLVEGPWKSARLGADAKWLQISPWTFPLRRICLDIDFLLLLDRVRGSCRLLSYLGHNF